MAEHAPPRPPDNARQGRPGAETGAQRNPEPESPDAPPRSEPSEPSSRRVLGRVLLVQLVALALLWALQAAYHR